VNNLRNTRFRNAQVCMEITKHGWEDRDKWKMTIVYNMPYYDNVK
jgi:hypothetical protein